MHVIATHGARKAAAPRRLAGDADVWVFIAAELAMFGLFFIAYMANRAGDVALYDSAQLALDRRLGVVNTLLLIASSWAVACAVAAMRQGRAAATSRLLGLGMLLGLGFIGVKAVEYSAKLDAGYTMQSNDFFMFYYCLTGIHLLHVVGGLTILLVCWNKLRAGGYAASDMKGLETGAAYWHMVDLLWIFLFPMLYLLR